MAKLELPIYGEDDEILKTYETNIIPWAVYIQAADLQERLKSKNPKETFDAVGDILKAVFKHLTDDELACADSGDVMNTFVQIINGGQQIRTGKKTTTKSKNV